MGNMGTTIPWRDLPDELVENIRKNLDTSTKIYVSRFRAVCRSWRSSIPPFDDQEKPFFPVSLRINPDISLTLIESVIYHLEPPPPPPAIANVNSTSNSKISRSWVIRVKQGKLGETQLLHPLSPFRLQKRPYAFAQKQEKIKQGKLGESCETQSPFRLQHPPNSFPKELNLLDFGVFELAKALHLIRQDTGVCTNKVAMSSNSHFPALMFVSDFGTLYHCELGAVTEKCTAIHDTISQDTYQDVIFHKRKFFAITRDGTAVVVDSSLKGTKIASPIDGGYRNVKYLTKSLGQLLLVARYKYYVFKSTSRRQFKVFKLNDVEKKWVQMKSLGNRILFVGQDCCFSAAAKDLPGSQRNCIYFSYSDEHDASTESSQLGVFNLGHGTSLPVENYPDSANVLELTPNTA